MGLKKIVSTTGPLILTNADIWACCGRITNVPPDDEGHRITISWEGHWTLRLLSLLLRRGTCTLLLQISCWVHSNSFWSENSLQIQRHWMKHKNGVVTVRPVCHIKIKCHMIAKWKKVLNICFNRKTQKYPPQKNGQRGIAFWWGNTFKTSSYTSDLDSSYPVSLPADSNVQHMICIITSTCLLAWEK